MTGHQRNSGFTRRRALAVTGGTVAAGGLAVTGYQSAFADTADTTDTATEATATGACMTLMSGTPAAAPPSPTTWSTTAAAPPAACSQADPSKGYKGSLSRAVDPDVENTGAGSGGGGTGGTPPSGAPTGAPPSGAPSESAGPSASASS